MPTDTTTDGSSITFRLPDTDGDGRSDVSDNCPSISNDQTNSDGDAFGDVCDNCLYTRDIDQADSNDD
jgi:syndecan 4